MSKHKKMKVGLFFGSFNPIHIGHLIIANHLQQNTDLDEVWFVVTPRSPFKKNVSIEEDYIRLEMVNLAIEDYPFLKASNIEFNMPQPNYTTHSLAKLREKHPTHEFCLIMGEDNLTGLHKWKNSEYLVDNYDIFVYPRLQKDKKEPKAKLHRTHIVNAPIIEISSTFIRDAIKNGKNIRPLLPYQVFMYIDGSNMYK